MSSLISKVIICLSIVLSSHNMLNAVQNSKTKQPFELEADQKAKVAWIKHAMEDAQNAKIAAVVKSLGTALGTIGSTAVLRHLLANYPETRGFITGLVTPAILIELILLGLQISAPTESYIPFQVDYEIAPGKMGTS
ncbi:MAG TPA: hypothetical protein VFF04_06070 [Candidatus Babeliales bacterium]|nr:hypothetical protein [Candidatus Babeliales bacterium]